ncbi:hypothetical protein GE21DRAFT_1334200 [Neurospora crassa]|nr:hypothetical protein GE21DRAFT_1334200 [Neurospora crassa]
MSLLYVQQLLRLLYAVITAGELPAANWPERCLPRGHIYLEKAPKPDGEDDGDFNYVYLANPSRRQFIKHDEVDK